MSAITHTPLTRAVVPIHGATHSTRLRLTRRGRAVIALLVSLPLAIALVVMVLNGGGATAISSNAAADVATITVAAGESLWSLAAALAPQASTADVVADLMAMNALASAEVLPGQVLVVPERYAG